MARSTAFRSKCGELVSLRQSNAIASTIYILRETGPTGYLLKEEGESKKFKVLLGDPHTCTCPTFVKEKELCSHICWVLLRKFRVSPDNPISWQLGLVEREISELLRGLHDFQRRQREHQKKQKKKLNDSLHFDDGGNGRPLLDQRPIEQDDVCAICQEELLEKKLALTYCKYGCGNSIHVKCMKVWADHQRKSSVGGADEGKDVIKCPFCREDFGSFTALQKEYRNATNQTVERTKDKFRHDGTKCHGCQVMPIVGKCYRCEICPSFHLCNPCFSKGTHRQHRFSWRQKSNKVWSPAERPSGSALPEAIIRSLMNRTLNSADYELLSQLDSVVHTQSQSPVQPDQTCPDYIVASLPCEVIMDGSPLLEPGMQCMVCLYQFRRRDRVKVLPACKHKFHMECIDRWLLHTRGTCPIDGQPVKDPTHNRRRRPRSGGHVERQRGSHPRGHQRETSMVDEGGFILFGNRINPSDLSPERSPFSPITSVHLQNALHLRDLPQDDPIAQMLRQMPENLALSSSEVMKGRPPQTSTHQPALFRFPLPNQRAKKPQTIQQTGVNQESPRLPPLNPEDGAVGGIDAEPNRTKTVIKTSLQPQASIPTKNRKLAGVEKGLAPIVSRLSSIESDNTGLIPTTTQSDPSTGTASPHASGASSSGGTASMKSVTRRRTVSQGSASGGARKKTHVEETPSLRKKSQSMIAVSVHNGRDQGRETGSGGKTRSGAVKTQSGKMRPRGFVMKDSKGRQTTGAAHHNIATEDMEACLPISIRDMAGLNIRQLGSFSKGLLSSNTERDISNGTHNNGNNNSTIYHGRRTGQTKRLAQPGRLVSIHGTESQRDDFRKNEINQMSAASAQQSSVLPSSAPLSMEVNVVAVTSPMSTLSEATLIQTNKTLNM